MGLQPQRRRRANEITPSHPGRQAAPSPNSARPCSYRRCAFQTPPHKRNRRWGDSQRGISHDEVPLATCSAYTRRLVPKPCNYDVVTIAMARCLCVALLAGSVVVLLAALVAVRVLTSVAGNRAAAADYAPTIIPAPAAASFAATVADGAFSQLPESGGRCGCGKSKGKRPPHGRVYYQPLLHTQSEIVL